MKTKKLALVLGTVALLWAVSAPIGASARGEVMDRVVAFVDDWAVTMSELDAAHADAVRLRPDATRAEVLETMINRHLLVREARRLRLEGTDDQLLIEQYTELKIKSFIIITDREIRDFFESNRPQFQGAAQADVSAEIERYLRERELNRRLRQHIEDLRAKAYVKVLPGPD